MLAHGLETAEKFQIYEGLPSSVWEPKAFASEQKAKATTQIDGQWFYTTAQGMLGEDVAALKKLFAADLFKPPGPTKGCGGFHADFVVRFQSGPSTYTVFFCFTCGETRINRENSAPKGENQASNARYGTDLNPETIKQLREFFSKYHKERPPLGEALGG